MQNATDILSHDPGHVYDFDPISAVLETPIGSVKICPNHTNGRVRVSNLAQYDRNHGYRSVGEPNGVSDLTVRGVPYIVDFWVETIPQANGFRVEIPGDISARRANTHGMDKASASACDKMRSEIGLALAAFLDSSDGADFLNRGKVCAARNHVAYKADKVREMRAALAEAESEMRTAVDEMHEIETAAGVRSVTPA